MALGPTERLASGVLQITPEQRRIAVESIALFLQLMRGQVGARINPSQAIPPADNQAGVLDASPGIGSVIAFRA